VVCQLTNQLPLSTTVKSRRLSSFGRIAQMNETAVANRVIFEQLPDYLRRPQVQPLPSWSHTNNDDDLFIFSMEVPEAREATQNRPL